MMNTQELQKENIISFCSRN